MTELRTLHITDIHDDWEKYEVIAQYNASKKGTEQAIDALLFTGDFIEGDTNNKDGTAHYIIQALKLLFESGAMESEAEEFDAFVKKYGKDGKVDLNSLDESVKKQFEDLNARSNKKQSEPVIKVITEAYQKHAEALAKIGVPVFGILGNHDFIQGYEILKENIIFLDKTAKASVKGKTGVEFVLKGDLNTSEVPVFYVKLTPLLGGHFIPYESGYSLSELSKQVNGLQAELANGRNERVEKIAKKEEPKYSEEQLKEMQAKIEYLIEARKEVLAYNQAERQRLGDKNEVDIYLTHKLPGCKKADPKIVGALCDVTLDYAANAKVVYGGHFHDGQIGYRTIDDFLKQESTETTTIDGGEVPVYYLDKNEPWELNPGTRYFFVTEYNANKEIERVIIHEFYYEEVA